MTSSEYEIRVFSTFDKAELSWRKVEAQGVHYPFQCFDWLLTWHRHIPQKAALQLTIVAVESPPGQPVAILPLGIERRWWVRRLIWLGEPLADYCGPLLSEEFTSFLERRPFGAMWREIVDRLGDIHVIDLMRQPENIIGIHNPFVDLPCRRDPTSAHAAVLTDDWPRFYDSRTSAKGRSRDRRYRRRLADHDRLIFEVAVSDEHRKEIVDALIKQKTAQYLDTGHSNHFRKSGIREFYRNLVFSNGPHTVHISALKLGDSYIACHWGVISGPRFYHLMPSYSRGSFRRYSPGRMHLIELFKWCFDHGIEGFDFTIGDERYKNEWCTQTMNLYRYINATSAKGRLYVIGWRIVTNIRQAVKGSPPILGLARKVRSFMERG